MKEVRLKGVLNTFFLLAIQFAGLLVIYALLRYGFYLHNKSLFPGVTHHDIWPIMLGGVKFDIVAILYINVLYILLQSIPFRFKYGEKYQSVARWLFISTNALGIALNLVDYAYYPFTLKRTTGTVLSQFANEENMAQLSIDFSLDYWYLLIGLGVFLFLLSKICKWLVLERTQHKGWLYYSGQTSAFFLIIFLFIGGVRGGWAHSTRPITLSNAGDYVKNSEEMNIVLNTPFSIIRTLKAVKLEEVEYFTPEELDQRYPVIHYPTDTGEFRKLNVVFLILESFGKEHIGALNKDIQEGAYRGYTPFLDSLIGQSYAFTRGFANGRKSIDALPSILTGIPSVGEPYVLSIYSSNRPTSLAKLLADEGYETAFFHGAPNGSMGFSAFTQLAGVKRYYGKKEYKNDADYDGIWGIWDEPFLQFMADKLDEMPQPFFASFFSLSSHHPFKVPEKYKGKFPAGPLPVHEPVGYTDYALKQFFVRASKTEWYRNTLFVLVADHATVTHLPEYQNTPGGFAIPIIFFYPGGDLKGLSDKLVQQIDIMPTVLNFLNYQKPYFAFGFDAFSPRRDNFVVNNNGGDYNFFQDDYYMTHDGQKPTAIYDLRNDRFLENNLISDQKLADTLDQKLKAFIQRYNYAMIYNALVAK